MTCGHFGPRNAQKVDTLEICWPSNEIDILKDIKPNQVIFVKEGEGITRTMHFQKMVATRNSINGSA
jgi:hypothetical protein